MRDTAAEIRDTAAVCRRGSRSKMPPCCLADARLGRGSAHIDNTPTDNIGLNRRCAARAGRLHHRAAIQLMCVSAEAYEVQGRWLSVRKRRTGSSCRCASRALRGHAALHCSAAAGCYIALESLAMAGPHGAVDGEICHAIDQSAKISRQTLAVDIPAVVPRVSGPLLSVCDF